MKVLLDTHILLWALSGDVKLPVKARKIIENPDTEIFYSIISTWEVELKHLTHPDRLKIDGESLSKYCVQSGFQKVPVYEEHIFQLKNLQRSERTPQHHDPFDRILICQAMTEDLIFVTHDARIAEYDEPYVFRV